MGMQREQGDVTILMAAAIPFLVLLLAIVVNIGHIVLTRERLQIAVDRAATAGAASLTYDLNRMAAENWQLHQKFEEVQRDFAENSEAPGMGEETLRRATEFQEERESAMRAIADDMALRAQGVAQEVFAANIPTSHISFPFSPRDDFLDCFEDRDTGDLLRERVSFDEVNGGVIFDPVKEREAAGGGDLVRFCTKSSTALVALGIHAETKVQPLLLPNFFAAVTPQTFAAAQPYGGSLKNFALMEADSVDEALEEGVALYRTAVVPLTSIPLERTNQWSTTWYEASF